MRVSISIVDEPLYTPRHITYEELVNGTAGVNIEEATAGVSVGTASVAQGRVTPDMKWIDIEIKGLRVKINEQSVKDAHSSFKKNWLNN